MKHQSTSGAALRKYSAKAPLRSIGGAMQAAPTNSRQDGLSRQRSTLS
eukprot:CAMPEP_0178445648 /NCGR_PEP_ID=MMETSP0689_2-20121128/40303_1 /TAXON_ID=160604 /ORGANISM="Amphidinium massartii, Strain CS-259" /LENGTH=47 /DNA_ID= /DNA_START= /DNA_END= /DNA_ORIENTATION=